MSTISPRPKKLKNTAFLSGRASSPLPSRTCTPTISQTPTFTPTNSVTQTPSPTQTSTNTPTQTPTSTNLVLTPSETYTPTPTPTLTSSLTPSQTVTPTATPTNTNTSSSTPTKTPTQTATPTPTKKQIYLPSDYLIITFSFTSLDGKDLDTRTQIIAPITSLELGFCKNGGATSSPPQLFWAGDQMGYGVESYYVNLTTFSASDVVKIRCKAYWWESRLSGNMKLVVKSYLGGTMGQSGTSFFNTGGTVVGTLTFDKNVALQTKSCANGEIVGTIEYSKPTQTIQFLPGV